MSNSIVKRADYRPWLSTFEKAFQDMFEDVWDFAVPRNLLTRSGMPKINVREVDNDYILDIAMAGLEKDNLTVEVLDNNITIKYEDKTEKTSEKTRWLCREISQRSFSRSLSLPEPVNESTIKSVYESGLLTITLPKKVIERKGPTRVKIE